MDGSDVLKAGSTSSEKEPATVEKLIGKSFNNDVRIKTQGEPLSRGEE